MIRLPRFAYVAPTSLADAAARLADALSGPGGAMLVAGGTDLVPNMKRRQQVPATIVGLRGVGELRARRVNGAIALGAMTSLTSIVRDAELRAKCPGLVQAAAQVATPHLRNMATLGGNLCLDTRCTYYDQSYEWRQAINFCMKKDGETCWVATSSPKCLAVSSTDTAPMLQALGARVRLVSAAGEREVALSDLYQNDGMHYLTRRPDEILADITIPDQTGWVSAYWKLRRRVQAARGARCGRTAGGTGPRRRPHRVGRRGRLFAGQADGQHRLRAGLAQEDCPLARYFCVA